MYILMQKVDAVAKQMLIQFLVQVQALADAGNTTTDTTLEKLTANYADDSNTNLAQQYKDYDAGITGVDAANSYCVQS